MKIIIPARLGSKGLPLKNRTLLYHTLDTIPEEKIDSCWVTTDDPVICKMAEERGFNCIVRPEELSSDSSSIRDVMAHAINQLRIANDELVVMLYLTYPERTWEEIQSSLYFFLTHNHVGLTDSLLCKKEVATHPYLCMLEHGIDGIFGKQVVQHDLYRRQDYPKCFEISHYIAMFKAGALPKLNKNLYCDSTVFYPIGPVIDVDTQKELEQYYERKKD